jgi:hypothetical protein
VGAIEQQVCDAASRAYHVLIANAEALQQAGLVAQAKLARDAAADMRKLIHSMLARTQPIDPIDP